jgi:RNA polymerase sigma-70 factor, ECF subfamily
VASRDADERLLIAAAQNDPSRFAELYDLHFETVYAFMCRRVHGRDAAEDLTSEVFQKALANIKRFEWRGAPFGAWLLRIAANAIADEAKRAGRELVVADPPERGVEPELREVEERARLFRLVEMLPEEQRRVIAMRFAEEKSIREIAQELARSEGAVKQLQFRALTALRTAFQQRPAQKSRPARRKKG